MKPSPLVSIVVNNYNYEKFLTTAIDSALAQTYSNVQVIVVDDHSTDSSPALIAQYKDSITAVFHDINGKQGAAFNSGFSYSKGDIILFLDADDYLYPHAAQRVAQAWSLDIAKIHYRLNVVNSDDEPRGFSYPQGNLLDSGDIHQKVISVGTYKGVPTSGNAISRWALEKVMPIPEAFNTTSDDYLSVLIPLYGKVAAIEEPLGTYRIHTSNQWALTEVTSDRFHRFIHHDLQRCELIQHHGRQLGYAVPDDLYMRFFGRAWSRLASLKLEPTSHPVPNDRAITLSYHGIKALWRYSEYNWQKRIVFTLWFLWVGTMPRLFAKPAIDWLFSPQTRPAFIGKTLSTIKRLITTAHPAPINSTEKHSATGERA